MTEGNLLDLVLIGMFLVFGLLGFWRGAIRTIMETAGILLGSEVALWWSDSIADRVVDTFNVDPGRAAFASALGLLALVGLAIGAFSANIFANPPVVRRDKLAGAVFGIGNGVLFATFVVRYYHFSLTPDQASELDGASVATALWDRFDVILVTIVAVDFAILVLNWVLFPEAVREAPRGRVEADLAAAPGSAGRTAESDLSRTSFSAPPADSETEPEPSATAPPTPEPEPAVEFSAPAAEAAPDPQDDEPALLPVQRDSTVETSQSLETEEPGSDTTSLDGFGRLLDPSFCNSCGMKIDASDLFCPDCGTAVGNRAH